MFRSKPFSITSRVPPSSGTGENLYRKKYHSCPDLLEDLEIGFHEEEKYEVDEGMLVFYYDSIHEAKEVVSRMMYYLPEILDDTSIEKAHQCDCGCGAYAAINELDWKDGWFYEDSRAFQVHPGVFDKEEVLALRDTEIADLPVYGRGWYIYKVLRSCIMHGVDYPSWSSLVG